MHFSITLRVRERGGAPQQEHSDMGERLTFTNKNKIKAKRKYC